MSGQAIWNSKGYFCSEDIWKIEIVCLICYVLYINLSAYHIHSAAVDRCWKHELVMTRLLLGRALCTGMQKMNLQSCVDSKWSSINYHMSHFLESFTEVNCMHECNGGVFFFGMVDGL